MKKLAVFFIPFVLLIIAGVLISGYYVKVVITRTVDVHFFPGLDEKLEKRIVTALSSGGYRIAREAPHFLDPFLEKYYPRLTINEDFLQEKIISGNTLFISSYYCAVDLTSDLVRLDTNGEKELFGQFRGNGEGEVLFLPFELLTLYKRILISSDNAEPLVFYKSVSYRLSNASFQAWSRITGLLDFQPAPPAKPLMVGFAGDFVVEDYVKKSIKEHGHARTLQDVRHILETPDIMSVNLEFVISHLNTRNEKKRFAFIASEDQFKLISDSPIDLVSCANNHAIDYGKASLLDTINFLDKYKILHSGTGKDRTQAFTPAAVDLAGNKVSFYSICHTPTESMGFSMEDLKAREKGPGAAYYDPEYLKELMSAEPERLSIVQFHIGTEYAFTPSEDTVKKARSLIDAGADAVICHHPHVVNGIEIYKGKIIAYSLGDFLLDIQRMPRADEGIILFLFIMDNRIKSWAFYPTVCHFGSVTLSPERIKQVEKLFLKLTAANM